MSGSRLRIKHTFLFSRHAVEPFVSRLRENGDRGPRAARPLRRGDGAPFGLGARVQRGGGQRRGELQAQASRVGDLPHQHGRLSTVWKEETREAGSRRERGKRLFIPLIISIIIQATHT